MGSAKGAGIVTRTTNRAGFNSDGKETIAAYSIWRVFFAIIAIIFLVEVGVMFLLPLVLPEDIQGYREAIADSTLLSLGAAPLLWWFFIRPLQKAGMEKIAIIAAVADSAAEGHLIFDGDGKIRSANRSASRIFSLELDCMQKSSAFDLLPQEIVDLCRSDYRARKTAIGHESGNSQTLKHQFETTIRRDDGKLLAIQISLCVTHVRRAPVYLAVVQDIEHRKRHERELVELHRKLLDTSRRAGMSEIATGVLHNVGNVLNSINVSANLLREMLRSGHAKGLQQAVDLLTEHRNELATFFAPDQKGPQLLAYLASLSETLQRESEDSQGEIEALIECVDHVKEVVSMQQSLARVNGVQERFLLDDAIDDAIQINNAGLQRHGVDISREYCADAEVVTERHKVIQILINLISNAKYAVSATDNVDKWVSISVDRQDEQLAIVVRDNGVGIAPEHLTKIFSHGFTTKKDGHGFGLHSSVLAAKELGGQLTVASKGLGCGATFSLSLPIHATLLEDEPCLA